MCKWGILSSLFFFFIFFFLLLLENRGKRIAPTFDLSISEILNYPLLQKATHYFFFPSFLSSLSDISAPDHPISSCYLLFIIKSLQNLSSCLVDYSIIDRCLQVVILNKFSFTKLPCPDFYRDSCFLLRLLSPVSSHVLSSSCSPSSNRKHFISLLSLSF